MALLAVVAAAGFGPAADPPVEKLDVRPRSVTAWTLPPGSAGEQVKWVIDRQKQLQEDFIKKYKATRSEAEKEALAAREYPEPDAPAKLLLDLAARHPKDLAAFEALLWVVRYGPRGPAPSEAPHARARDILMRDFLRHPRIGELCQALSYENEHAATVEFVREVFEKHPDAAARAPAGLARAQHLRRNAGFATSLQKANPEMRANFEKWYGPEYVAFLRKVNPDDLSRQAEAVLDKLVGQKELAAVTYDRRDKKRTVGESAEAELFEMRYLLPGKPAPEITGEDVDGKRFNLSDYRGKVVLLDFWGDW
jgi:hypothetical protein